MIAELTREPFPIEIYSFNKKYLFNLVEIKICVEDRFPAPNSNYKYKSYVQLRITGLIYTFVVRSNDVPSLYFNDRNLLEEVSEKEYIKNKAK